MNTYESTSGHSHRTLLWLAAMFFCLITAFSLKPATAFAATVQYADPNASGSWKIGNYQFEATTAYENYTGTATLYQLKDGSRIPLYTQNPGEGIRVKAVYGKWLYFTCSQYGADQSLYRCNLKSRKVSRVRTNAAMMLIHKDRLYTVGFATDISSVPIYVSKLNGKGAKCITKNAEIVRPRISKNRIYYLEKTFNSDYTKIYFQLVSSKLDGSGKKVLSQKLKTPSYIVYFTSQKMIYSKVKKSGKEIYYLQDLRTGKKYRIRPSQTQIDAWFATMRS